MASTRERSRRLNQGVFISGASGSGKSRMTERLARPWKRRIFVDPMASFVTATTKKWPDAAESLATFWNSRGPMHFGVTFTSDQDYARFFGALSALLQASEGQNPNFLLVIDEIDLWSGPQYIDPALQHILRYGRHYGCSWIANCRADVHTNRDVRMNAVEVLLFRQGMLSKEAANMVAAAREERELPEGQEFPRVSRLRWHGPDEPKHAIEYVHFVAVPDPFDEFLPRWEALAADAE